MTTGNDGADGGVIIQGIDFDNNFGSTYISDCVFDGAITPGGWFIPSDHLDELSQWQADRIASTIHDGSVTTDMDDDYLSTSSSEYDGFIS